MYIVLSMEFVLCIYIEQFSLSLETFQAMRLFVTTKPITRFTWWIHSQEKHINQKACKKFLIPLLFKI